MKISKYLICASFAFSLFSLTGCNDFLDKAPSKTTYREISSCSDLDALLNDYKTFTMEQGETFYGTDDYGLNSTIYNSMLGKPTIHQIQNTFWSTDVNADISDNSLWSLEYKKIFIANLVLNNIDNAAGDDVTKSNLRAEAHFIRAYSYFLLANTYCLPYTDANKSEMGLPLKQTTSFIELDSRNTLEETYNLIENDLTEALKTNVSLYRSDGKIRTWRANVGAVNAFAARYWLMRGDYTKAQQYAEKALAINSQLIDYNTEMGYSSIFDKYLINESTKPENITLKYPSTYKSFALDPSMILYWKESYYARGCQHTFRWFIPSQSLLDMYTDKDNDLRYHYFMVQNYSLKAACSADPAFLYPGYVVFFDDVLPSGPSVPEMILIKAECQARSGNYQEAMKTVNVLRAKRIVTSAYADLSASSQADAVKQILAERRREMPFAMRWYDIRRLNFNDDPTDDVTLTKSFYNFNTTTVLPNDGVKTYTLTKDSRRYALPIPPREVSITNGDIKQNTY
jgi:tetratricopeptide (TPR) repeat protein